MDIRKLSPLLQEKAERELNEEPSRVATDISAVKEWLKRQPHLQSVNPSDQWILSFLRGNKFSLEKTKSKLDMYYTLRTIIPEIFHNRNPFDPTIQAILKKGPLLPLRTLEAEDSCRICLEPFGAFGGSGHRLVDLIKVSYMIFEIMMLEDDNFIISGEETLIDVKGLDFGLLSQWTPTLAKKAVAIFEKGLSIRVKSLNITNATPGVETAAGLLKIFLSDKMKNRINIYSENSEKIYKTIPRKMLPKEYGGEGESMQELIDYWKTKVESYSNWFLRQEKECSDESLRPGAPKTSSNLFGVEGSFRKLAVD